MPQRNGCRSGTIQLLTRAPLLALGLTLLLTPPILATSPPDAQKVGNTVCLVCHEDLSVHFAGNIHARLGAGGDYGCEACHGPGSVHSDEGDPATITNPARDQLAVAENLCLNCHKFEGADLALGTAHYEIAGGCTDCHKIHSDSPTLLEASDPGLCFDCHRDIRTKAPLPSLLKASEPGLCLDCHRDIRTKAQLPSHHPVLEGLVKCSDCHAVHGGAVKFATMGDNRDLCFSCHASKQGPFIFEHEPVNEDCGICHDPHGTVADNLLVQNEPFLCLTCHPMHFHTQLVSIEGTFNPPLYPERGPFTSTKDAMKEAFLTKCTQCHSEIHGSDLPSQPISTGGRTLTR
jgi:predicted CXXCH cytochrome family protein